MKPREVRLLLVLMGLFFIAANVVAGKKLIQKKKAIEKERVRLALAQSEMEELLAGREGWRRYGAWLDENQPVFEGRESVEKELLESAAGAADHGVTVTGKDLLDIEELDQAIQAGIWIRAEGSLESLLQWFHELQHPEAFRVIRKLRLMPDSGDVSTMTCEFLLLRWYQSGEDSELAP